MDDSTSAVDTKTDALIRKAMRDFIPETTKFIIAQRISSVQDADMIIVMEGGTVSAAGTHEELLKTRNCRQTDKDSVWILSRTDAADTCVHNFQRSCKLHSCGVYAEGNFLG